MESDYRLLGLEEGASIVEVRSAYRRLAKRWHPDTPEGDRDRFEAIYAAHRRLVNAYLQENPERVVRPLTDAGKLEPRERLRVDSRSLFDELPAKEQDELIRRGYSEMLMRGLSGESEPEATRSLVALNWPRHLIELICAQAPPMHGTVDGVRQRAWAGRQREG